MNDVVGADKLIDKEVVVPTHGNGKITMIFLDARSASPGAPSVRHVIYHVVLASGKSVECLALNAVFTS